MGLTYLGLFAATRSPIRSIAVANLEETGRHGTYHDCRVSATGSLHLVEV